MASSAHLSSGGVDLYLEIIDGALLVQYWGATVAGNISEAIATSEKSIANSAFDLATHPGIMREHSRGFLGHPTISGHRDGSAWSTKFVLSWIDSTSKSVKVILTDDFAELKFSVEMNLDSFGMLKTSYELTNTGNSDYTLDELLYWLPLSDRATQTLDFSGRWSNERNPQRRDIATGTWIRDSREGRSGHNYTITQMALTERSSFGTGEVWAVSLGWSGNSQYLVERTFDGMQAIGAGEVLMPGEIILKTGEKYCAPDFYATYSRNGLDGIAENFHSHIRARPEHPKKPRPLTLNMWEAIYFDHNESKIKSLVDAAAEIGVERMVLDDGWFFERRNDRAGLGDWVVDEKIWPLGLDPIIDYIDKKGMEFGLWFEGEMVNPDSQLFRNHPDWILQEGGRTPPTWRHQLVLDLANPEVYHYLLEKINAILSNRKIKYIKWDHNRVLVDAGNSSRAAIHRQTKAIYRLFAELKSCNPGLEIESCASGGARIDLGVINYIDRFWTSDNNDALERQNNQRWTMQVIPPELLGTHIGPNPSHQTGRTHNLSFRATTALFGHAGIEWDISNLSQEEISTLKSWADFYKKNRKLLHNGKNVRIDYPDDSGFLYGVVSADKSHALFSYVQLRTSIAVHPPVIILRELDPLRQYKVSAVFPAGMPEMMVVTPPPWITAKNPLTISGSALMEIGLPTPILRPENALLIELQ